MSTATCVMQFYRSLWIFWVGGSLGFASIGVAMFIAWMSSESLAARIVGIFLALFRGLIIL